MKTNLSNLAQAALTGVIVLGLAAVISLPFRSTADTVKGAQRMIQLNNAAVTPAISVAEAAPAMACPTCKDKAVTTSTMAGKGAFAKVTTASQQLCPACKDSIQTTGPGKAAVDRPVHACGSADANGCAMK